MALKEHHGAEMATVMSLGAITIEVNGLYQLIKPGPKANDVLTP
jgi:hypothetical protein